MIVDSQSTKRDIARESERETETTMTADVEISDKLSAGGEAEERSGDVDTSSLKDSSNYSSGRYSVEKRARIEHPETLVKRSSGHHHSREKEREKLPLTMTADLEISLEKSASGEEQLAGGEEQYGDVDMPSLEDSAKNSNGRHSVGKRVRIEHPEILVISFKVPFSLECKGCESVIAKGVRINAEKKLVGNYYGTKIWSFTIKCAYCGQKIVMERVSGDSKYVVIKGTREKRAKPQGKGEQGCGVFPSRDLIYRGYSLPAVINVKARDEYFKARGY